jgi:tetratricopeptide (TPR) repeat protein
MKLILSALLITILFISCGSKQQKAGHSAQVETLLSQNKYSEALQYLSSVPPSEETTKLGKEIRVKNQAFLSTTIANLKQSDLTQASNTLALAKAHLDMGLFMEYYGDHLGMKERMTGSLAHFRKALQLEPSNAKALAEINQIEGIYKQMGREVPQEVAE